MTDDNFFDMDTPDGFYKYNHNEPGYVRYHNAATFLEHAKKRMKEVYGTIDEDKVLDHLRTKCTEMVTYHNREKAKLYQITAPIYIRLEALKAIEASFQAIDKMDVTEPDDDVSTSDG